MFGGNKNSTANLPTVIGEGAIIHGDVKVSGSVQIDGQVHGTLDVDGEVSVGPKGEIHGELIGTNIAIGGLVEGMVTARKHLQMVSSGRVKGDAYYDTLQVDRGAVIDGRTMHNQNQLQTTNGFSDAHPAEEPTPVPTT